MEATPNNTVFLTCCDYPNPAEVSATLRNTAVHFGVNLEFTMCKKPFRFWYDKFPKVLDYLYRLPPSIKYMFFMDCRDSIFADTPENILTAFNEIYTGGVLYQCGDRGLARHHLSPAMMTKVIERYTWRGFVVGGMFGGLVTQVIKLLQRAIRLHAALCSFHETDPLVRMYWDDPFTRQEHPGRHVLVQDDPLIHIIQTGVDAEYADMIQVDLDKRVTALFGNSEPGQGFIPLKERRALPPTDIRSVGTAGLLHSPALANSADRWNEWVISNVLRSDAVPDYEI